MKKRDNIHIDFGLGGLFKGLGNFFELVAEMSAKGENEVSKTGQFTGPGGKSHGVYGFTIRLGLGGKPVIEEFGNISESETGPKVDEVREPIVDILDEGTQLLIIAELPGIEEESISVSLKDDVLTIYGAGKSRIYKKDITLPVPVDPASRQLSHRNGIIEVRFTKHE